jgi:hypothetical protein
MAPGKYEAAQVIMLMYVSDSQNLTMEYVILFITFRKKKKKHKLGKSQLYQTRYHLPIANNCLLSGWVLGRVRDRLILVLLSEASSPSNSRSLTRVNIGITLELSSIKDVNYVLMAGMQIINTNIWSWESIKTNERKV